MYDSSVKIPSGLITGNYKQLGNFDECLKVRSDHGFIGQACNAAVHFEIAKDDGAPREMDIGDLFVNVAIASVSSYANRDIIWIICTCVCVYLCILRVKIHEAIVELNFSTVKKDREYSLHVKL